jgi:Leucine-rich repeat (LRR) protein
LVTIETIDFQKNELTAIPTEMGTLTNMTILNLKENKLINVPQSVCDLRTINGGVLTLLTDLGVGCN